MISCGWCGKPTANHDRCSTCGHVDPARPWTHDPGRPPLDPHDVARRIAAARAQLGSHATVDQIAEALDVAPRTVRRWQQKMAG